MPELTLRNNNDDKLQLKTSMVRMKEVSESEYGTALGMRTT